MVGDEALGITVIFRILLLLNAQGVVIIIMTSERKTLSKSCLAQKDL